MNDEGFFTVAEVAEILRTTPNAIYVAIAEGRDGVTIPPSIKLGRRRLFSRQDYRDWHDGLLNHSM